ncbi:MAG: chorismate synthase [Nitrososphaerota archaeon]
MTGNILGERFIVISFGESHGKCIGAIVEGCPAGLKISEQDIQKELDKRKAGISEIYSSRKEEDKVEILSGIFNGFTTGAPICMIIWNKYFDSKPYEEYRNKPRPGHADYTAYIKYGGFNDWRGGGRFSGRITASFIMAGAIAKKLLNEVLGIKICAYTIEIGGIKAKIDYTKNLEELTYSNDVRCPDYDTANKMKEKIISIMKNGDSIGGIIECLITNVPIGLGEPIFSSLESDISKAIFSIPAVKGIEFGAGFNVSKMLGSESNDVFIIKNGKILTEKNNSGGILGGISNGMPIIFRIAIKPTPSISKPQKTIDLSNLKETTISIKGMHDPCIVPRAVPVVENIVACILADHAIRYNLIPPVIKRGRKNEK